MNALNRFADPIYCIARFIFGLNFASHGGQLLFGMFGGMPGSDKPILQLCGWICLVGGLLIAFGLLTRLAAFISSGTMAVAYFMVHAPNSFFPIANKGELAVSYCWFFLYVLFYGPGRWSIDALIGRGRTAAATT
ncbi:MAG TPA: DoxX family protein [Chthoniobacterales bacterium]|jgi:putative oxidoreductase|nr:DoxX family protein [Chthoniobacterales bacterium]